MQQQVVVFDLTSDATCMRAYRMFPVRPRSFFSSTAAGGVPKPFGGVGLCAARQGLIRQPCRWFHIVRGRDMLSNVRLMPSFCKLSVYLPPGSLLCDWSAFTSMYYAVGNQVPNPVGYQEPNPVTYSMQRTVSECMIWANICFMVGLFGTCICALWLIITSGQVPFVNAMYNVYKRFLKMRGVRPRAFRVIVLYLVVISACLTPSMTTSLILLLPMMLVSRMSLAALCNLGILRRVDGTYASYEQRDGHRLPVPVMCQPLLQCRCCSTSDATSVWNHGIRAWRYFSHVASRIRPQFLSVVVGAACSRLCLQIPIILPLMHEARGGCLVSMATVTAWVARLHCRSFVACSVLTVVTLHVALWQHCFVLRWSLLAYGAMFPVFGADSTPLGKSTASSTEQKTEGLFVPTETPVSSIKIPSGKTVTMEPGDVDKLLSLRSARDMATASLCEPIMPADGAEKPGGNV